MLRPATSPRWSLFIGLAAAALLLGLIVAVFISLPELTGVFPVPGAQNVSSRAPIRLTFSRPMDQAAVEAAFRLTPPHPGQLTWQANTLLFTPAEPWPVGATVQVSVAGSKSARGLPLRGETAWSFGVSQPRVVYLAGSPPNLWTLSLAENSPPQAVTAEAGGVADYDVSPDGLRLVYAARRSDGGADLRMVNVDGTGTADLLACPEAACQAPVFAPDGERVVYEHYTFVSSASGGTLLGAVRVHVYTLATGQDEAVGDAANEARTPRWSPAGRLAYYDVTRQAIAIRDLASGAVTYVPDRSGEMGTWAPDGQSLVFPEITFPSGDVPTTEEGVGEAPTHFSSHLLRVTLATNATDNLSGSALVDDGSPAFAPAGDWLAFGRKQLDTQQWTPGRQLWLMRPAGAGAEAHALTADPLYNYSAFAWKADGAALVYMRFNPAAADQPAEIWTINSDGTSARLLVTGGYLPKWLP